MTEAKASHTIGFLLRLTGNNSVGKNMTLFDLTSMTATYSRKSQLIDVLCGYQCLSLSLSNFLFVVVNLNHSRDYCYVIGVLL